MSKQFSLEHLSAFSIGGPDALNYAQSQFTVAVDSLSSDVWSSLAWCDPKGRVIAVMMGRASESDVELVVPAIQADSVREQLQRFTIGRRAEVSPTRPIAGTLESDSQVPALSFDPGRGMLAGAQAPVDEQALARWRQLDLCHGLPWLEPATSGQHLPQWLGLEELGAVAYDKGCYPGQEVIARLHYRGSVKYRLAGLLLDAVADIDAQTRITDRDGAGVGHWLGGLELDGRTIGLAVLSTRVGAGDDVLLPHGSGAQSAKVTPPEALC